MLSIFAFSMARKFSLASRSYISKQKSSPNTNVFGLLNQVEMRGVEPLTFF